MLNHLLLLFMHLCMSLALKPNTSLLKRLLQLLLSLIASLLGLISLYTLVAVVLSVIPVNEEGPAATEGIAVYITTNGVHADFTVPVATPTLDWRQYFPLEVFPGARAGAEYLAFGWGDKGFYLHTPRWSDLTLSTAVNAILLPSPTAMHVTYYRSAPAVGENCRKLYLSQEQYRQLVHYILNSFEKDREGQPQPIEGAGYTAADNFYEARGSYSLFYTCNNWVNEGLKKTGIRTSLWTPFDKGIMYHLE